LEEALRSIGSWSILKVFELDENGGVSYAPDLSGALSGVHRSKKKKSLSFQTRLDRPVVLVLHCCYIIA
jgi:hypothetical protein